MMIDYILRYDSEELAQADIIRMTEEMGAPSPEIWQRQYTIPDIKVWQPTQDYTETVPGNGMPEHERVVHSYVVGYFVAVSLDHQEPVLLDNPALQFALDREQCNAGKPFVIRNNIGQLIYDIAWEPMFAGSSYPLGGYVLM